MDGCTYKQCSNVKWGIGHGTISIFGGIVGQLRHIISCRPYLYQIHFVTKMSGVGINQAGFDCITNLHVRYTLDYSEFALQTSIHFGTVFVHSISVKHKVIRFIYHIGNYDIILTKILLKSAFSFVGSGCFVGIVSVILVKSQVSTTARVFNYFLHNCS